MSDSKSLAHIEITPELKIRLSKDYARVVTIVPELGPCWLWREGTLKGKGYGQIGINYELILVHRLAFYIYKSDPGEMDVLHKCDVPNCFNPEHLFLGTQQDNIEDCKKKERLKTKFSNEIVAALRNEAITWKLSIRALARKYNMSEKQARNILDHSQR